MFPRSKAAPRREALGRWAAPAAEILHEEELAVTLQAYARAGVTPASSAPKFSWHELRDRFIAVCDGRADQAAAAQWWGGGRDEPC